MDIRTLFGETLAGRRVRQFRLSERVYPARLKTPRHAHRWPFLCLVIEGWYALHSKERSWACRPPALMFYPQDATHWERFGEQGARLFIVELNPRWFRRIQEQSHAEPVITDFPGGMIPALSRRLYKEFLLGGGSSALILEGLILLIIGEAMRLREDPQSAAIPPWLKKAHEMLGTHFTESFTIERLAGAARVHPVHLAQMFRKHYGCTVGTYIRKLRVEFASRQLAETEMPLVDIALAAGFCDQSHFTKTFRQYTGMVPSDFRKSLR